MSDSLYVIIITVTPKRTAFVPLPYQRQWIERMTGMKPSERLCLYANRWSGKRYAYEAMRRIREMQQNDRVERLPTREGGSK